MTVIEILYIFFLFLILGLLVALLFVVLKYVYLDEETRITAPQQFYLISESDLKYLIYHACADCADMHEVCVENCHVKEIADLFNLNVHEIVRNSE